MENFIEESICKKYCCRTKGLERIYSIPLVGHKYDLEYTTPYFFQIENFSCSEKSWTSLLYLFSKYCLLEKHINLLSFNPSWTRGMIFINSSVKNSIYIGDNVYLIQNKDSQHAIWILVDLIKYGELNLENSILEILRLPKSEPLEIRNFVINKMEQGLKKHLTNLGKNNSTCDKIINNFKIINDAFRKVVRTGYDNFYLISNLLVFYNYKAKFLNICKERKLFSDQQIDIVEKHLLYYQHFLKGELAK